MPAWLTIAGLTLMAGAAMVVGAGLASVERIRPDWLEREFRHSVIAFGGGALLSAVALVLVPEGSARLPVGWTVFWFALGGLAFLALDVALAAARSQAAQLAAMLADFVPEALALGAAFTYGGETAVLLALLIALQNLPEGFNACRELGADAGLAPGRVVLAFAGLALLGPVAGLTGYLWLTDFPAVVGGIMLFAAGGILYLIFEDIAPQARLERSWAPPLGAVAGFVLGLAGERLTGG